MIFFKKLFVLKTKEQNKVCGHVILTNQGNNAAGVVKFAQNANNAKHNFLAECDGDVAFSTQIDENVNSYNFTLPFSALNSKNIGFYLKKNNNEKKAEIASKNNSVFIKGQEKESFEEKKTEENEDDKPFFEHVREKVKKMFDENEHFPILEEKISGSKWVKVNFDESGLFYVLGIIYENDAEKFVCYGIPSNKTTNPPKEIENFCSFVQTSENGDGFYIMKQNTLNGECEK